jgi:hypothetical protein
MSQGFKKQKGPIKKAHQPRASAPKVQKNRHFKDKQQQKLTATIANNIENLMMDKA